jgi:hypothetical protein
MVPTRLPTSNWACATQAVKSSETAVRRARNPSLVMVFIAPDNKNFQVKGV